MSLKVFKARDLVHGLYAGHGFRVALPEHLISAKVAADYHEAFDTLAALESSGELELVLWVYCPDLKQIAQPQSLLKSFAVRYGYDPVTGEGVNPAPIPCPACGKSHGPREVIYVFGFALTEGLISYLDEKAGRGRA